MTAPTRILIVAALAGLVVLAVVLKRQAPRDVAPGTNAPPAAAVATATITSAPPVMKLPRLLDLGAGKCIPCKAMAPILEELRKDYAGRMIVEFIDVWQDEQAGTRYGVEMIPTQIFFDADGKELFRHTGFYGREDILAKWKELGVVLDPPP